MRRLAWLLAATLVVAATLAGGWLLTARLGPERVRAEIERRLVAELGPVSVGAVRPFFAWGIGIEIADVRSLPAPDGTEIAADRIWVTLAPRSVLRGEPRVRRIEVSGLHVAALRAADGSLRPELLARLVERAAAAGEAGSGEASQPDPADPALRARVAALPALTIDGAQLRMVTPIGGASHALALRDLKLELARRPLRSAPSLRVRGRLALDDRDRGAVALEGRFEEAGPRFDLSLTDADLEALGPWLGGLDLPITLAGRTSGVAAWTPARDGGTLALELLGFDLRATAARGEAAGAATLRTASARLTATASLSASALRVSSFEWNAGETSLQGSGSLDWPLRESSRLGFSLKSGPLDALALRDIGVALAPEEAAALRRDTAGLAAGRIVSLSIAADPTPLTSLRRLAAGAFEEWPATAALELEIAGIEIRLGGGEPIRDLGGRLVLQGERLELHDVRARLGDRPLPRLELAVEGLNGVAAGLSEGAVPPAVTALEGRIPLQEWIDSFRKPGAPPRWTQIDVDLSWLEHPALLRSLEDVHARLRPADPGVHIEAGKGFWGGVPFEIEGSIEGGDDARIEARVALALPRRRLERRAGDAAWSQGSFEAELEKLGNFQATAMRGELRVVGDRVELRKGDASLRPRGRVTGSADVDLSRTDTVPYHLDVRLEDGSASEILSDLSLDGSTLRGVASFDASLDGEVRAGLPILEHMRGPIDLKLRDGEINQEMNVLLAIAQASETLNPFRSRKTIPYTRLDAPLVIGEGWISTEGLNLDGPALRMLATGRVNVLEAPYALESVVGVFYFRTLDRLIGVVPLLNRLLLGPDDNLISTYFAVTGPWADPSAMIVPIKSIASGPGSLVLEGVPSFVRGSLVTIQRLLGAGSSGADAKSVPDAEQPPSAADPTP